jgi:hypothetical protein
MIIVRDLRAMHGQVNCMNQRHGESLGEEMGESVTE